MFGFSQDQINGTLRTLSHGLVQFLIGAGILNVGLGSYVEAAIAAVLAAAAAWYFNRPAAQIAKTANLPEVKTITVTTKAVADEAPANVVKG